MTLKALYLFLLLVIEPIKVKYRKYAVTSVTAVILYINQLLNNDIGAKRACH